MPKLLRCDLLKPLDVILLRSPGWFSTGITKIAGGEYSHAVLVISRSFRFESNEDTHEGIYFTPSTFDYCYFDGPQFHALEDVSRYPAFGVFRHPDVDHWSDGQLATATQRLIDASSKWNFLEYPDYQSFEKIIRRQYPRIGGFVAGALSIYSRFAVSKKQLEGPFCSALIAEFYSELGVQLFEGTPPKPDEISPFDLSNSRLRKLENLVAEKLPEEPSHPRLCHMANRICGRLRKLPEEYGYIAEHLKDAKKVMAIIHELANDQSRQHQVDPARVKAAETALDETYELLQGSDRTKAMNAVQTERSFWDCIENGDASKLLTLGDLSEVPADFDWKTEANFNLAPIRKHLDAGNAGVYDRLAQVNKTAKKEHRDRK